MRTLFLVFFFKPKVPSPKRHFLPLPLKVQLSLLKTASQKKKVYEYYICRVVKN